METFNDGKAEVEGSLENLEKEDKTGKVEEKAQYKKTAVPGKAGKAKLDRETKSCLVKEEDNDLNFLMCDEEPLLADDIITEQESRIGTATGSRRTPSLDRTSTRPDFRGPFDIKVETAQTQVYMTSSMPFFGDLPIINIDTPQTRVSKYVGKPMLAEDFTTKQERSKVTATERPSLEQLLKPRFDKLKSELRKYEHEEQFKMDLKSDELKQKRQRQIVTEDATYPLRPYHLQEAKDRMKHVLRAIESNNPVLLNLIQQMKLAGSWYANNETLCAAMEKVFQDNKKLVMEILLNEGVQVTPRCINFAVENKDRTSVQLAMEAFCAEIKKKEGSNAVEIFPAYRDNDIFEPCIVLLERAFSRGAWEKYRGIDVYRRRYDFVSLEAANVMSSEAVLNNLPDLEEMKRIQEAINSFKCTSDHSNITLISACPVRSKREGDRLVSESCITIHCLVKGFIPYGEEHFPKSIHGIPVDVREGYCFHGMMNDDSMETNGFLNNNSCPSHVQNDTSNRLISTAREEKVNDFNKTLRMGIEIGPFDKAASGTLGGFVQLDSSNIGFLTCAHVVCDHIDKTSPEQQHAVQKKIVQPSDSSPHANIPKSFRLCGEVYRAIFDPGAVDRVGVDAAIVKVSFRHPQDGSFAALDSQQLYSTGFSPNSPPTFSSGNVLSVDKMTKDQRNMAVIKVGASTGLTRGLINIQGAYVKSAGREMVLPDDTKLEFFNQIEVLSVGGATRFFDFGDSGSLVFLPEERFGLRCIGMAIGHTNYGSCLVTPIENVLEKLNIQRKRLLHFDNHIST